MLGERVLAGSGESSRSRLAPASKKRRGSGGLAAGCAQNGSRASARLGVLVRKEAAEELKAGVDCAGVAPWCRMGESGALVRRLANDWPRAV